MITIQELLISRGLSKTAKIKMVRHKDQRYDIFDMYRSKKHEFERYQSAQSEPKYKGADYLVSFIGEDNNRARLVGVYKIIAELPMDDEHRTDPADKYYYQMDEMSGFEDLVERVVVKWSNAIAWVQWFKNDMEVIEISAGLSYRHFKDYMDFVLPFAELKEIIDNQYPDWKKMLSAVYGVYIICDNKTGQLYIGSAYGEKEGIWGRWTHYVKTGGHADNKSLKALINKDVNYAMNFSFSLLVVMSKSSTDKAVIEKEQIFKRKFGTMVHGLNNN